ncbi:hypothetical protein ACLOJK_004569 [Asimina triloba]
MDVHRSVVKHTLAIQRKQRKRTGGGILGSQVCRAAAYRADRSRSGKGSTEADLGREGWEADFGSVAAYQRGRRSSRLGREVDRRGRRRVWAGTQVLAGKTTPVAKKDADGVMEDGSRGGGDADRRRWRRTMEME